MCGIVLLHCTRSNLHLPLALGNYFRVNKKLCSIENKKEQTDLLQCSQWSMHPTLANRNVNAMRSVLILDSIKMKVNKIPYWKCPALVRQPGQFTNSTLNESECTETAITSQFVRQTNKLSSNCTMGKCIKWSESNCEPSIENSNARNETKMHSYTSFRSYFYSFCSSY